MKNPNTGFSPEHYAFSSGEHRGKKVIWIKFPRDQKLLATLKEVCMPYWSATQKSWYVTDNKTYRTLFHLPIPLVGKETLSKISTANLHAFTEYQNMLLLKGFSQNTMRTYSVEFAQLLYIIRDFPVWQLTPEKLKSYFLYCTTELALSENQIHSRMNAVKFYFEKVLHRDKMFFDIPRPKKPLQLPKALNTAEIKKLFAVVENPKHRLILQLCYGMGLRVSEIAQLKIQHIDSAANRVLIERGKGKKDRYVNLPVSILQNMRDYYRDYRPKEFLFEGQFGGHLTTRSVQQVFKLAMLKAGIRKKIGIHGLRHSYATHLLEYGTDISLIQRLLGHNDIRTTLIYTHVTDRQTNKVASPLDKL
ncbi:tyrosine-type recombinase/integrase [Kaistella palustris]|uniref:tyrosine-type recombinase/integrase n=1 Tax=Kaistella palustris TaxID=493376 RepID=UPI00041166F6|nr:tyrosine-type recombinase/integrase [Kaistella palustris]